MPLTTDSFWKLLNESRLFQPDEITKLAEGVSKVESGHSLTPEKVAKWLASKGKLSQYQTKILLSGRAGPFYYGDYQIYDRIESGRLAGIFRAIHVQTRHPVCLFFLSGAAVRDAHTLARLAQQAATANRVSVGHPHLFRCYHLADEVSYKFVVIEDLQGRRVERLLATKGPLASDEACRIVRQAALGLARLHAMGQTHGEIRPANVWLDKHEQAKLLLFPLYRDPMTAPRSWLANLAGSAEPGGKIPPEADYIAPELIDGNREPDARSDIYALGCTLYHMLGNQVPFPGSTLRNKLRHHQHDKPRPLEELNEAVSPALAKLVGYMMAKDPDLRYQKAESVVEGLLAHLSPGAAQTQPKPPSRSSQAYEAWLHDYLLSEATAAGLATSAAAMSGSPQVAAATPSAMEPVYATTTPIDAPMALAAAPVSAPVGMSAAVGMAAPMAMAAPLAMAAPMAMAAPVGVAPMAMAAPVGVAAPVGAAAWGAAPMMATPVYAAPVEAGYPTAGAAYGAAPYAAAAPYYDSAPRFDSTQPPAAAEGNAPGASLASRSRNAKRQKRLLVVVGGAVTGVACMALAGMYLGGAFSRAASAPPQTNAVASHTTAKPAAPGSKTPGAAPKNPAGESHESTAPSEPIAGLDDGIWGSPTSNKPLQLIYFSSGLQGLVAVRPAAILRHPQGHELLMPEMSAPQENLAGQHPLGILGHWLQTALPALCATPLDKIEQVIIGWPEMGGESNSLAIVARLAEPANEAQLVQAWGNPQTVEAKGARIYKGETTAYLLPASEGNRTVVIAPMDMIAEALDGTPAMLLPELQMAKLLAATDSDRMFTALVSPRFLSEDGKAVFEGVGARLLGPVDWLLTGAGDASGNVTEPPKAILLSAHLTPDAFFAEARLYNSDAGPQSLAPAQAMRDRVHQIPKALQFYMVDVFMTDYSKQLLFNFVDKVKAWSRETRFGAADKQVVVRSYLPAAAALHMALSAHLCLLENTRGGPVVDRGKPAAPAGNTVADKLKKVTSLSFPRNTLEVSMQLLAEDLGVPVVIIGTDLQLEGITKNQSFGLDEMNKSATEIFKTIFAKANTDGKLVYVIKPNEQGVDTIYVTTRAAVAKRGDKLPPEFAK